MLCILINNASNMVKTIKFNKDEVKIEESNIEILGSNAETGNASLFRYDVNLISGLLVSITCYGTYKL